MWIVLVAAGMAAGRASSVPDSSIDLLGSNSEFGPRVHDGGAGEGAVAAAVDGSSPSAAVLGSRVVPGAIVTKGAVRGSVPVADLGDVCLDAYDASHLDGFLSAPHGPFQGGDYQRAFELDGGRALWVFQDAFLSGRLVHNAAMLQQGRCFTLLNDGTHNWLFDEITVPFADWWWILDANHVPDAGRIELVVADMLETGRSYLSRTRVRRTVVVTIDDRTFEPLGVSGTFDSNPDVSSSVVSGRFYGWAVVDDAGDGYRYLYSHCYAQYGFDSVFGAPCSAEMFVARVAGSSILGRREYWTGRTWSPDSAAAVPMFGVDLTISGNNPGAVRFEPSTGLFHLVIAVDDWWSNRVVFATSRAPQGPWTVTGVEEVTPRCADCNSYFASWAPTTAD
ncbi:MAG: hypothetical protein RLZZ01_2107, partial [Actinomycetota bacterium]